MNILHFKVCDHVKYANIWTPGIHVLHYATISERISPK